MYRVQVTSTISDPTNLHAQDTYCQIGLLTSLEALFGIISSCLPMLKALVQKLQDFRLERGASGVKSFLSGTIPIVMRRSQMPHSSSGKQYLKDSSSMKQSSWYEEDMVQKCEGHGSPGKSDSATQTGITGKSHFRAADAENVVSDV